MSPPDADNETRPLTGAVYGSMHNGLERESSEVDMYPDDENKKPVQSGSAYIRDMMLIKTQSTFLQDAIEFNKGSIPHSMVLGAVIGVVCGTGAFIYYAMLEWCLEFLWHDLPEMLIVDVWPESTYVLWIPILGFSLALGVGLTVQYMGEPGDLPYTIKCVHESAYVAMDHVMPMVCASQFSILGGGSLGPEAPLVAICAALGGFISRSVFGVTERNLVRKHTLMGMSGALAAFFGCPLGGSLFALEVNSRFGVEYFEHSMEAIFSGEICLAVFRWLAGLPISPIWVIQPEALTEASSLHLFYGAMLGLVGAGVAWMFAKFHGRVMKMFGDLDLLRNERAVPRAMLGAVVVVGLGMMVPATMFWGEYEIQTIATLSKAETLEHIWPTAGLFGFEMDSFGTSLIIGFTKLIAISFTVAGGYRGGYIFPAFASASALGRAIYFVCPFIPAELCVLCMAAALNVALTRTALATTLILAYLSGEQQTISSILAASLVSLFVTAYMPFIKSQAVRADIDNSVYHFADQPTVVESDHDHTGETIEVKGGDTPMSEMHKTPYQQLRKADV